MLPSAVAPPVTRVLVVDDSVVVRRLVARAVEADPACELVGWAVNGRLALEKFDLLCPDVVVLDLEMPEMDGFETLAEIRRRDPKVPVVIFSHLTRRGAAATLDALAAGATDFALKPTAGGIGMSEDHVRDHLLPLIRDLAAPRCKAAGTPNIGTSRVRGRTSAVVAAVSTGGPNALAIVLSQLTSAFPVPILIVQHMPPVFTKMLAERLDGLCPLSVVEATADEEVEPGRIYLAPGGRHLSLARSGTHVCVVLSDGPPENSCRPAADVLFRSAVEVYGGEVLAVVLTGMGQDGLRGARLVRAAGGAVMAQSLDTAVAPSMPGAVIDAGLSDAVVGLDHLGTQLQRWVVRHG